MSKPNEVTIDVLMHRLKLALTALNFTGEHDPSPEQIAVAYKAGNFHEFEGVVEQATAAERLRASHVCRRLGHTETARKIAEGT